MRRYHIWVVGGDARQGWLAKLLAEEGHTVHTYGLEEMEDLPEGLKSGDLDGLDKAHCVILPLPALGEGNRIHTPLSRRELPLEEVLDAMAPGQTLCAGKAGEALKTAAAEQGIPLYDYFAREELAVANAVPTAEGAVELALEELPVTLHGSRVLVLGFGRVGKITAHRFAALGCKVTVAARKWEALAWAEAYGYAAELLDGLDGWLCGYDLVVNTIPTTVLTRQRLMDLKEGCLVIDLASKPGGVDLAAAGELGVKVVWALSLPGKVAPVTAGKIIRDTVYHILHELEG